MKRQFLKLISLLILLMGSRAAATPAALNFQGRLVKDDLPVEASSVSVTLRVVSPGSNPCLLFEENQTLNMTNSDGHFSVAMGAGTRTSNDRGLALTDVFSNTGVAISSLACSGGATSYTPATTDSRYVYVSFSDGTDTVTFDSPYLVQSVPYALEAQKFAGKVTTDFLQVKDAGTTELTQANIEEIFTGSAYTYLQSLLSGNYVASSSTGASLPSFASAPAGAPQGSMWYDSATHEVKYKTNSGVMTIRPTSSGVASVANIGAAPNAAGLTITGTALNLEPASATMPGAVTTGTQTFAGAKTFSGAASFTSAGTGLAVTNSATIGGALTVTTSVQTNGNLYFNGTAATNPMLKRSSTALEARLGNDSAYAILRAATPSAANDVATKSYVDSASTTLSTLANGNIFVGNASNVSTAATPSGDVTMTNAGVFTVNKIKNITVSAAPTVSGQVLRFDGTNLVPNHISMLDLRSTVTGTQALSATCDASQTLTFNSATDSLACSNIAIANTQVTGLGTAATLDVGTGANEIVQLDASSKLPAIDGSELTDLTADNLLGTIGGAVIINTSGNITTSGNVIGTNVSANNVGIKTLELYKPNNAFKTTIQPLATLAADYTLTLPPDNGASDQVLTTDGNGVLSWTTPFTAASLPVATTGIQGIMQVGTGLAVSSGTVSADFGSASGKIAEGNDARFNPTPAGGNALNFMRVNAGGTAYEARTPANVLSDISAMPSVAAGALGNVLVSDGSNWGSSALPVATANTDGVMNTGTGLLVSSGEVTPDFGTGTGKVVEGDDDRLNTAPVIADALKIARVNAGGTAYEVVTIESILAGVDSLSLDGQLSTGSQTISGGSANIDWDNGNMISTDYDCSGSLAFANLRDGGSYTLVITEASTTQCTFSTTTTGTDGATVAYRFKPANAVRTSSSHTLYNLKRVGDVIYVTWESGY